MYNTSKYSSYIYADRNIRPCTIQGYTLATFPNIAQFIYAQPEKQAKELCSTTVTAHRQALSSLPTYTLSQLLSAMELCKTAHQCGVCIGLYILSSRHGLRMGCRIAKGVSERCVLRLLLTSLGSIEQKILLLEHVNSLTTEKFLIMIMTGI